PTSTPFPSPTLFRSSSSRWAPVSRPASSAGVREATSSVRSLPVGGATSASARAGGRQYASAVHSASSTSSGGIVSGSSSSGAARSEEHTSELQSQSN